MIKDKVMNMASEAYIKGAMFVFMVFLARNLGDGAYADFVGAQALMMTFLPVTNMGMETSYLLDPRYRRRFRISEITASKIIFVLIGLCGYLVVTYALNNVISNVTFLFAVIYVLYVLNSEYILLVNKGWKKIALSNLLFGSILLLSYFSQDLVGFTIVLMSAYAIKFLFQSHGTLPVPKWKEFSIRPAKKSRYIFFTILVSVLYLNILKLILYGSGQESVLREYDLIIRYLALGELMFVVALRQFAAELYMLETKKILYLQVVLLLFSAALLFSPLWKLYTSLITLEPQPIQIKSLSVVYLFLAMNNQLIGQKLQSDGKAKDTFYAGLLVIFFLTVVLCMGFTLTNLYVCLGLLVVMKVVEALFTYYKLFN